jgi:hypothetical protein
VTLVDDISNPVAVDFESYWSDTCTITKQGASAYLRDPRCEVYLVTVLDNEQAFTGPPQDFDWPSLEGRLIVSANASFDKLVHDVLVERGTIEHARFGEWNCVTNCSAYLGGPRALKAAAKVWLGREIGKDYRKLTKGRTAQMIIDEGNWGEIVLANIDDATATRDLALALFPLWTAFERRISIMTYESCHRGLPIDVPLLLEGIEIMQRLKREAAAQIPWAVVEDEGEGEEFAEGLLSPKSLATTCAQVGLVAPKSTAEDDRGCQAWEAEHGARYPWVGAMRQWRKANMLEKRALVIRDRMVQRPEGTFFPYAMKYFGAQNTGRWSGGQRGGTEETGFNPQNFPKKSYHGVDLRRCISVKGLNQ